jgi:hypothetical protein
MELKTKQQSDQLYSILDAVIEGVNMSMQRQGTGLSFEYSIKAEVPKDKKDKGVSYRFTMKVREMGHGERELQTIPFIKPESMDKFAMEVNVIMAVFTILAEHTVLNWLELGKILNTDSQMQKIALEKK